MIRSKVAFAVLTIVFAETWAQPEAQAQRLYTGSSTSDSLYFGSGGIDSNGRVINAQGPLVDRFGYPIDDYGRPLNYSPMNNYYAPSHSASGLYYSPGAYSGYGYSNGIGYSVGVGGYSGGFLSHSGRFGTGVGVTYLAPPRTVVVGGVYPTRTVINNATRGGVVEYTNNGNGYIYSPGTSSQTVITSGPSIFPSTTVIQPAEPPVLIQAQRLESIPSKSKSFASTVTGRGRPPNPPNRDGEIRLICPKESSGPVTYALNGTAYTIKPGYSQTFPDDRVWTVELLRGGNGSQPIRYDLRAGNYRFTADENGWDLKQLPAANAAELPPSPTPELPPAPAPIPSPEL